MDTMQTPQIFTGTVSDELDRLEIPANKIGLINSKQAMELLQGLDAVYARIQDMSLDSQSRKQSETQFESILAKLRAETPQFLRDLGGAHVLRQAREKLNPPQDREWWYLDVYLAENRRVSFKKILTTGGVLLVVLTILVVVYNNFLAPDPIVSAIYGHEHNARDLMISGDLAAANAEVDQALELNPQEPTMLILKGVIQEGLGDTVAAEQAYTQSQQILASRELFLLTRGQAYLYIDRFEPALLDGQEVVRVNPNSAQGYLLIGQANELLGKPGEALDNYDKAFAAAEKTGQTELAAITRTRIAMLMQTMNTQIESPMPATETP